MHSQAFGKLHMHRHYKMAYRRYGCISEEGAIAIQAPYLDNLHAVQSILFDHQPRSSVSCTYSAAMSREAEDVTRFSICIIQLSIQLPDYRFSHTVVGLRISLHNLKEDPQRRSLPEQLIARDECDKSVRSDPETLSILYLVHLRVLPTIATCRLHGLRDSDVCWARCI